MKRAPRDSLAFAADVELERALALYSEIKPYCGVVKVGLSLFTEHGPRAVEPFLKLGAKVFLDLKLFDIPNTLRLAVARAAKLGVSYLTLHASGGEAMMRAAHESVLESGTDLRLLAVTVLTSFDEAGLKATGVELKPMHQAIKLAELALKAHVDGFVCSPSEAHEIRYLAGPTAFVCTPGVRPLGADTGDQQRVETPQSAIKYGADMLVVGRPIYEAKDPVAAAQLVFTEIEEARKSMSR